MRPATFPSQKLALAAGLIAFGCACSASQASPPPPGPRDPATLAESPTPSLAWHAPRIDSDPSTYSACAPPSVLRLHAADDTSDPAVPSCAAGDPWATVPDRDQASTGRCDIAARPELLAHVLSGALPLDAATMDHIRTVYREGQKQSRRDHAFGLVGDSLTNAAPFMHPFTTSQALAVATREPLSLSRGGSVVDLFRTTDGSRPSSYEAPRAAKDGVRASWPLQQHSIGGAIPIDAMISAVSPAYAVVLFGANDALFRTDSLPALRNDFTAGLSAIVDALERRGVIPLLSTVPKHMRERGWPDCPSATQRGSNEVFAAQATALSAAVAEVACQRHVPLIDLRWALDPLQNHGVGPDGVHLSVHPSGGAILDNAGLQCGYNVRNLVTLRELALVVDAVDAAPATSTRAVPK